jgi:hypothetical protein
LIGMVSIATNAQAGHVIVDWVSILAAGRRDGDADDGALDNEALPPSGGHRQRHDAGTEPQRRLG